MRERAVKILAHHYLLVFPLLIGQLARISPGKMLVILLDSTKLGEGDTILFNTLRSSNTIKFEL